MTQTHAVRPTAQRIADSINANCERYHAGAIAYSDWDAEQQRLWKLAAERHIAGRVMRLVAPSCEGK